MPHLRLIKRDNFFKTPNLTCLYAPEAELSKEDFAKKKPSFQVRKKLPFETKKYMQQFEFER